MAQMKSTRAAGKTNKLVAFRKQVQREYREGRCKFALLQQLGHDKEVREGLADYFIQLMKIDVPNR